MTLRSFLVRLFLSGTALTTGLIGLVICHELGGIGGIIEYLGPNKHLFEHVLISRNKGLSLPDTNDRSRAVGKLSEKKMVSVPYLISLLNNFDSQVRLDALTVLGKLEVNIDALPNLTRLLNDPDREVRLKAISVMGMLKIDAKVVLPNLTRLLNDPDQEIRASAARSISCVEGEENEYCYLSTSNWGSSR